MHSVILQNRKHEVVELHLTGSIYGLTHLSICGIELKFFFAGSWNCAHYEEVHHEFCRFSFAGIPKWVLEAENFVNVLRWFCSWQPANI